MANSILDFYIYAFKNLKKGTGKIKEEAPHKPVMLLSIIQAYEEGVVTDDKIYITPELTEIFKSNWNLFVDTPHTLGFALPFFRLKNEKGHWWELVANLGCELWVQTGSLTSFGNLNAAVSHAKITGDLADLLIRKETRDILRHTLLRAHFPDQKVFSVSSPSIYLNGLQREMLEESPVEYSARMRGLQTRLDPETYQIEVYARDTMFRREIVRLYDDMCCVTGIRVSAPYTFSMVDACHIVPFFKTFNNHPTNGIALCPNLHRAFDKGAIAFDSHYRVIVSHSFIENEQSIYSLSNLTGIELKLPNNEEFYPDLNALAWHRDNIFKH